MSKNSKFGIRLKDLREEAGISMQQLAKAIGVSDAAVCKWENGQTEPKASYIVKLAEYFECTTDYLIGSDDEYPIDTSFKRDHAKVKIRVTDRNGNGVKTAPVETALLDSEQDLIVAYRKLSPDLKSLLRETARALSSKSTEQRTPKKQGDTDE